MAFRTDMYLAMGFPDTGATPGHLGSPGCSSITLTGAVSGAWECPSNPEFSVIYSCYQDQILSSYMYLANGWGTTTGSPEKDSAIRPVKLGYFDPQRPGGSLPLFGDKVEWDQNTAGDINSGTWTLNHDGYTLIQNVNTGDTLSKNIILNGANQAFTDGHAQWVDGKDIQSSGTLGSQPGSNASMRHTPGNTFYSAWWWY